MPDTNYKILTIIVFLIITYCKVSNKIVQLSYMAYNYQLGMSFHVFNNTTSFQFFKESRRCTWNDYHHVVTRWKKKAFDAMQRTKKKVLFFTINRLLSEYDPENTLKMIPQIKVHKQYHF